MYSLLKNAFLFLIAVVMPAANLWSQEAAEVYTIDLYDSEQASVTSKPSEPIPNTSVENDIFQVDLFGGNVTVPDLNGLTWTQAVEKLAAMNLLAEKKNPDGADQDIVHYQNPRDGKEVEMGTTVGLRLVTPVPEVVGKTLEQAYDLVKEAGFEVKYFRGWDKDYEVTGQSLRAGSMDIRGKTITLQCSVAVPDVRRKTVAEAKKILAAADLYTEIDAQYRDDDIVFDQKQKPGRMIPRRFYVEIKPAVQVPNVTNVDIATAETLLIQSGIAARVVAVNKIATFNPNEHGLAEISLQAVQPGGYLLRGNTLELKANQLVYQQLQLPVIDVRPPDFGEGFCEPENTPNQQMKCPDCGRPVCECSCYLGGG